MIKIYFQEIIGFSGYCFFYWYCFLSFSAAVFLTCGADCLYNEVMLSKLRHWFVPHHSNNFRAKALHPQAFVLYIAVLLAIQLVFSGIHRAYPAVLGFATNVHIDELLRYTNDYRAKNNLPALNLNPQLSASAVSKANYMFANNYWAHNSPDGKTPWEFILQSGYEYSFAGENLARDFNDSQAVVNAWINSPSHRENLLRSEYQDIGFAVINGTLNGRETTLVVQMFGARKTVATAGFREVNQAKEPARNEADILASAENVVSEEQLAPQPLIDEIQTGKNMSIFLIGGLVSVLTVDGLIIFKRKDFRIAGHNMAHFIFLLALIGLVILGTTGSII